LRVLLVILALLVAARVSAPYLIEWRLNEQLSQIPDYVGEVEDVDLGVFASRVSVEHLRLDKRSGPVTQPFLWIERAECDYQLRALLAGRLVADVTLEKPEINLTPSATQKRDPKDAKKEDEGVALAETARTLGPAWIDNFHVKDGLVRYRDTEASPPVDLVLSDVNALVTDLSNTPAPDNQMPTHGRLSARVQDSGKLRVGLALNVFAKKPTFDLDVALQGLDVRELRDMWRAYVKADPESGRVSFYSELRAKNGGIQGYFKPMLHDVRVYDPKNGDAKDPWYRKIWEGTVGLAKEVFENEDTEQAATRVPIRGRIDEPGIDVWRTIVGLLGNAFVEAIFPGIDRSVGGAAEQG
jgi:hypothetical protein